MALTYRIYGHGDTRSKGFPTPESLEAYIGGEIFSKHEGRYRYSETYFADRIVLSRDGFAYGHFDIDHAEQPTAEDRRAYDKTNQVFIVTKSTLYQNRVGLKDLGYIVRQRGRPIDQGDFERILAAAGATQVFLPQNIDRRYCRICYSLNGWRRPSGAAEETRTYFAANGFGHEEWLFNYEWCIGGYKYGFLQPFTRHLAKYQGNTFSLKLYTNHRGHSFFAGTIGKVYVPYDEELAQAYAQMEANGWIDQMKADIEKVGGNVDALAGNVPNLVLNVRFDPADVTLDQDMPEFIPGSKPAIAHHYVLLHDDDEKLPNARQSLPPTKRSELQFLRAAQQGAVVDPMHARLQNKLYDWLCAKHGKETVGLEVDFVDLRLTLSEKTTFFEIKTDPTAKRCIRNALGQLFEYSAYPAETKADQWIVVGDPMPTADDAEYLKHLRTAFQLPIFYAQFDWETGSLHNPI